MTEEELKQQHLNEFMQTNYGWQQALNDREAALNARPQQPGWQDLTKGSEGRFKFELDPTNVQNAVGNLRAQANRTGPSQWAQLMNQQQDVASRGAQEELQARNASGVQNAWSQLAMRGGASGGERERIAMEGMRGLTDASQKAQLDDRAARLGIATKDEEQRQAIASSLPQTELLGLEPQKWNSQQAINERDKAKTFELGKYSEQMRGWAANKQADATANSGKKS
jgi:hypothetical protein